MIKNFEEYINEDYFSKLANRKDTGDKRKGIAGKHISYDGEEYIISNEFIDELDIWNTGHAYGWTYFAFKKPTDGKIIYPEEGKYCIGYDKYDCDDEDNYDVYVLRTFYENSTYDITKFLKDTTNIDALPNDVIKNIVLKYIKKLVLENHLSDLVKFNVFELDYENIIKRFETINIRGEMSLGASGIQDDETFEVTDWMHQKEGRAFVITFPYINNWCNPLEKDLVYFFKKDGWTLSNDVISITSSECGIVAFYKLNE